MDLGSEEVWALARRVCTPAELEALRLHEQSDEWGLPLGYRRIAVILGVSFDAARDRVRRAEAKVLRARAAERL